MKRFVWSTATALAVAATGFADDPPKKADPPAADKKVENKADDLPPMEKLKEAKKDLDDKQKAMQVVMNALREKGEKLNLENKELKVAYDAANKAREVAQKVALAAGKSDPKSKDGADALFFAAERQLGTPDGDAAADLIIEHHINDTRLGMILGDLMYGLPSPANFTFLEKVESKAKSNDVIGAAKTVRGVLLLRSKDEALKSRGVALLETIAKDYPDAKIYSRSASAIAEGNLFEYRYLSEGKPVPDIEGEDMDEAKFKLSDYRGKVVMLDFWGHW